MKRAMTLCLVTAILAMPVLAQEDESDTGLLKRAAKVDKPIAETYEPLNSTYVGDGERLNESIEQSWELKKRAQEREQAATEENSPERQALEERIQEPGGVPAPPAPPVIRDTGKGLEIKGD